LVSSAWKSGLLILAYIDLLISPFSGWLEIRQVHRFLLAISTLRNLCRATSDAPAIVADGKWSAEFGINGPFHQSFPELIGSMSNSSSGYIPCPSFSLETKVRRTVARPQRAILPPESFEDWVYAVIAASTVVALLLGILNQLGSPVPGARSAGPEWTSVAEHPSPSQGKDGKF
jgi:hypothetical protein